MDAMEVNKIFDPDGPNVSITISRDDLMDFAKALLNGKAGVGSSWLTAKEASEMFGIAFNNLKSAKWRQDNDFPTHQPGGPFCKPMFLADEISSWLQAH